MTNTDHDKELGSSAQEPSEMPLPGDPKAIFLGGLFILAALGAAYLASEIVLPNRSGGAKSFRKESDLFF